VGLGAELCDEQGDGQPATDASDAPAVQWQRHG